MNKKHKKSIEFKIQKNFQDAYSLYNPRNPHISLYKREKFPFILKNSNTLKKSRKTSLSFKFYKLLLKGQNKKMSRTIIPYSVDKNTFVFKSERERADSIERKKREGHRKHLELCKISNKKRIEKMNSAREFKNKMKLIVYNNIENIKKIKNLEEKKKMQELVRMRNINYNQKKYIIETKEQMDERIKKEERRIERIKKRLQIENNKIKDKYNEIMTKIKEKG